MRSSSAEIERGREILARANEVVVLTGAGISADSGVPTFRGPDGLWKNHRPEELATPEAFARDPRLVWEWYGWRRDVVAGCRPNAGHLALARWALRRPSVRIVTQNVDGLHTLALEEASAEEVIGGAEPVAREAEPAATETEPAATETEPAAARPIELHGSLFRVRCTACPERYSHRDPVDAASLETLPRCRRCGGLLRPDVVWFGEPLPEEAILEAFTRARRTDACLVVGTSAVVYPAAGVAAAAHAAGAPVVEVNPDPTPLTRTASVSLRARAAGVLPELLGALGDGP